MFEDLTVTYLQKCPQQNQFTSWELGFHILCSRIDNISYLQGLLAEKNRILYINSQEITQRDMVRGPLILEACALGNSIKKRKQIENQNG